MEINENGERNFSFARKPGADTQLRKEELDRELLSDCRIFHFGSLSLTDEPSRSATWKRPDWRKRQGRSFPMIPITAAAVAQSGRSGRRHEIGGVAGGRNEGVGRGESAADR